ncbi:hypothetical protein LIER_39764 [Lithospermum erythrorhizon]|uniref:Uncharacterized protein n=1 Tax=Lithospermum erythrorhizon TaxID=34254 RepID=A0AAV3QKY8_LITER
MSIKKCTSYYKEYYLHSCESSDNANELYTELLKSIYPSISSPLGVVELSGHSYIVMKKSSISLAEFLEKNKDKMVNLLTDLEVEMVDLEEGKDAIVGNKRKRKQIDQHVASVSSTYRFFLSFMKDVLKFAIFHNEEDNIDFLQSLHEHGLVEKD